LIARADLALRSNPVSKRMVLERLVMELTTEPKVQAPGWMQDQLPV
jgi:DNA polymerase-3 subunit delta